MGMRAIRAILAIACVGHGTQLIGTDIRMARSIRRRSKPFGDEFVDEPIEQSFVGGGIGDGDAVYRINEAGAKINGPDPVDEVRARKSTLPVPVIQRKSCSRASPE